ncbi:MAG TPA: alpha/beta fold hydrolase [Anaerolineae bacterium]|nr:alpha/beta fold hydrolase [Anaerolineae bacterium]
MKKWKGDITFLVVVGVLVGGWLYLYPTPADSPLQPLDPPAELGTEEVPHYASQEGLALAYRLFEPAGAPQQVLIVLHDTLLHGGWYAELGQALAVEGVAVYLPDRRGRGRSAGEAPIEGAERADLVEDIAAMVVAARNRYPQAPIYLGAHGRAAGLATSYLAAGRPAAGLVLLTPVMSEGQPNVRQEGWHALARAHPVEALLAQSGLIHWHAWRYNWPSSMQEADPLLETGLSIADLLETMPDDLDAAYAAVTVPLLVVQGAQDPLFLPEQTEAWMSSFLTGDRYLETVAKADYLTVIPAAAEPIARWLAAQEEGGS